MSKCLNETPYNANRMCAPYPLMPEALLLALGYECRCAKLVEHRLGIAINPLRVESFVRALRIASSRYVGNGVEVIGILDPFWIPAKFVESIPIVVFKKDSCARCLGPRWILYRVAKGVYLQVFSSISVPSADEIEEISDRLRFLGERLRVNVVELSVAPKLMGLERIGGLDAALCSCVGQNCEVTELSEFIKSIVTKTSSRYGTSMGIVLVGSPRIRFEEATYIWIPAPSPSYIETLDRVVNELEVGKIRRCRIVVENTYLDPRYANPFTHFSKQPLKAVLSEICQEIEVAVASP